MCAVLPSTVLGAFARGLRAGFGLSAAGVTAFVDDISLTEDGLMGADIGSVDAAGACVAIAGALVTLLFSTAVAAPALRCSVAPSSL